ncbi:hypothetical protein JWG39_01800 [Desulforhopalus vacuolatus]|uniref:hypothetical protein n=1 Tax=Desulforhopalus vacuolatus TaxID=40414 RepID=UPI001966B35B|nr:hypothetical protein [Desulforhopalus vacuolatus]MBM9518548.1 hypothetical protein [Desulforhopalus vacuolatus]
MTENSNGTQNSDGTRLLNILREGIGLVQMIFYRETKKVLVSRDKKRDSAEAALLAGAITGEVFGTLNPGEKFVLFRQQHRAEIEQELLSLRSNLPELCQHITDALRVQALCDHQEGNNSTALLHKAKSNGYLTEERETPLPSSFMTSIRELGAIFDLVIPPVDISTEDEKKFVN